MATQSTMNADGPTSVSPRFTIASLLRVQFVVTGLLAVGAAKERLLGGNGVVVVLVALLFACVGRRAVPSSFTRFATIVVTIAAGGIGAAACGRMKVDLLEAGLAGLLVGALVALGYRWTGKHSGSGGMPARRRAGRIADHRGLVAATMVFFGATFISAGLTVFVVSWIDMGEYVWLCGRSPACPDWQPWWGWWCLQIGSVGVGAVSAIATFILWRRKCLREAGGRATPGSGG